MPRSESPRYVGNGKTKGKGTEETKSARKKSKGRSSIAPSMSVINDRERGGSIWMKKWGKDEGSEKKDRERKESLKAVRGNRAAWPHR